MPAVGAPLFTAARRRAPRSGRPHALIALIALIGLAGCGGSARTHRDRGQALFTADCAACHSLSEDQTSALQGGDLRDLHTGRAAMLQFVAEMPTPRRLSRSQMIAVADYVLKIERG